MPDMAQTFAVVALFAEGPTTIRNVGNLRVKETDRIAVMARGLAALGIAAEMRDDGLRIEGGRFHGGVVDSAGDHRVAMSFAIAALRAEAPVEIRDVANVATSFPGFAPLARSVGLDIEERP